ncbi:hypothetical protein FF38_00729 [Lucilia cuprina]|uniref:DUF4794 domain-containing protein n=1 Tax=Lucilia cuprina TaxID=7375 RepID=A0A0L0CQA5_LUCCU|nr:hypothetical protein CVS40_11062 [Lucilia cuprina]KNC34416.1 hypothetical protein FF38_00729 [Lucilia cuprina]
MKCKKILVKILIIAIVLLSLCEARGGRRGGSFGGLFGSWRKYKKPSSGGGTSRRIVSSSPVHTPITKAMHENKKSSSSDKFQKNFKGSNYYNTPPLPTGGSYYHNTAALPGNAIYVAQAPPRGSEFGDFLTGYLTGRLLTMGFSSPHYHVTHVYRDNPSAAENTAKPNNTNTTEKPFNVPLAEITTTTVSSGDRETRSTTTTQLPLSTTEPPAPTYGIICMPMLINETNENGETVQNERTVCYPAPAPPTPQNEMKSKPVEIAGDIMDH